MPDPLPEASPSPCALGPCFNGGACAPAPNSGAGYSCRCPPGFHGSNCERRADRCANRLCLHGERPAAPFLPRCASPRPALTPRLRLQVGTAWIWVTASSANANPVSRGHDAKTTWTTAAPTPVPTAARAWTAPTATAAPAPWATLETTAASALMLVPRGPACTVLLATPTSPVTSVPVPLVTWDPVARRRWGGARLPPITDPRLPWPSPAPSP